MLLIGKSKQILFFSDSLDFNTKTDKNTEKIVYVLLLFADVGELNGFDIIFNLLVSVVVFPILLSVNYSKLSSTDN